jgi:hypothetical protein
MPLTNSRGLGKVVFFSGLKFPVVITPNLMGEPIITSQAFYFLERLDSVVKVRFELPGDEPSEREIEYVIDNYLFEYSKKYPDSKLTSKITEFVYWRDDPDDHYFRYDWRLTECLVLDTLNDDTIVECKDPNHPSKDCIYDWCLFRSYFQEAFEEYQKKLKAAMRIRATVTTKDHSSLGTGIFNLPIIKVAGILLTLEQAEMFEVIEPGKPKPNSLEYFVSRGMSSESNFRIEQELITATSYHDEQLLAYYFSAVRDFSPVSQFKNYYNVLEYFFEEAPAKIGVVARIEKDQIEAVLRWAVSQADLSQKIRSLPADTIARITKTQTTSSGEIITGLNPSAPDIIGEYASHIYQLRNACIHSKKTRKGTPTPRIVPSSAEEEILKDEIPVLQWLAVRCIEK